MWASMCEGRGLPRPMGSPSWCGLLPSLQASAEGFGFFQKQGKEGLASCKQTVRRKGAISESQP